MGGAIDRLGHGFNHRVAARLKELGLEAEPEYKMTRLGGVDADDDVDTLAWDAGSGNVYVIECKRLLADKTVGEIAERLVEYGPNHVQDGSEDRPASIWIASRSCAVSCRSWRWLLGLGRTGFISVHAS